MGGKIELPDLDVTRAAGLDSEDGGARFVALVKGATCEDEVGGVETGSVASRFMSSCY